VLAAVAAGWALGMTPAKIATTLASGG
jgi:hypothetical protein